MEVTVRQIFTANKGGKPGEYLVPPLSWEGLGFDMCLVGGAAQSLILTNHSSLYVINIVPRQVRFIRNPLGKQQEFVSVAASLHLKGYDPKSFRGRIFMYLFCSDYTIALITSDGHQLERFGGFNREPWGFDEYPDQMEMTPSGSLFVWFGISGRLLEIGENGRILNSWKGVSGGFAINDQGRVLVASAQLPVSEKGITWVHPYTSLKQEGWEKWRLIGVDKWGGLYWQYEFSVGDVVVTEVARSCPSRGITWSLQLNGPRGVIPIWRRGRSQIEKVVVRSDGTLYIVGFDYVSGGKVRMYEMRVSV